MTKIEELDLARVTGGSMTGGNAQCAIDVALAAGEGAINGASRPGTLGQKTWNAIADGFRAGKRAYRTSFNCW